MMRRHTHGWMTQQSNQGAVSGASDQGGYTRNLTAGGIQQEGQNKEETGGSGGQGDRTPVRRARGQGEQGGYSRRDRIRRRTGEGGIPLGDTAGTLKACKLVVVQQQDFLDTH